MSKSAHKHTRAPKSAQDRPRALKSTHRAQPKTCPYGDPESKPAINTDSVAISAQGLHLKLCSRLTDLVESSLLSPPPNKLAAMFSSSLMQVGQVGLPSKETMKCALPVPVLCTYTAFGTVALLVYHFVAEREFSSILTMSVIAQALAISFLCAQVLWNKSARGISIGALTLDGLSVAGRMPSTTWSEGYLPMDLGKPCLCKGPKIIPTARTYKEHVNIMSGGRGQNMIKSQQSIANHKTINK